jgi:ARG and Rhodanese-Phosphatase-superfamily-associated Protein domain
MPKHLNTYLKSLTFLTPLSLSNLVIVPIVSDRKPNLKYWSVKKAMQKNKLIISEVDNSGIVGQLQAENKSDTYVFILDGEQLVGAKQNRIVNISILLKPHSTTILPVSCVEQGRWHYKDRHFKDSDDMLHYSSRSAKSQRISREKSHTGFSANQGRIWLDIQKLSRQKKQSSATGAMHDVYEKEKKALDKDLTNIKPVKNQVGFVIFQNEKYKSVDIISRPDVFADLHDKILRSHLIENSGPADIILDEEKYLKKARKVLKRFKAVHKMDKEFPGAGKYFGIYSDLDTYGVMSFDKQVIHMTAQHIVKAKDQNPDKIHNRTENSFASTRLGSEPMPTERHISKMDIRSFFRISKEKKNKSKFDDEEMKEVLV